MQKNELLAFGMRQARHIARQRTSSANSLQQEDMYSYLLERLVALLDKTDKTRDKAEQRAYVTRSLNGYSLNFIRDQSTSMAGTRGHHDMLKVATSLGKKGYVRWESCIMLGICKARLEGLYESQLQEQALFD